MALTEGQDYLFFKKVHVVESRLTAKFSEACLLTTPKFLFVIPKRSMQSLLVATRVTNYQKDGDPAEAVDALLHDDSMTLEALEGDLAARLAGDSETRVFKVDELEIFEMKTGFFGQTKIKAAGDKVKLINIRGKGNKVRAKEFYEKR